MAVQSGGRVGHLLIRTINYCGVDLYQLANRAFAALYDAVRFCSYNPFRMPSAPNSITLNFDLYHAAACVVSAHMHMLVGRTEFCALQGFRMHPQRCAISFHSSSALAVPRSRDRWRKTLMLRRVRQVPTRRPPFGALKLTTWSAKPSQALKERGRS
jgi:hypothetical protein